MISFTTRRLYREKEYCYPLNMWLFTAVECLYKIQTTNNLGNAIVKCNTCWKNYKKHIFNFPPIIIRTFRICVHSLGIYILFIFHGEFFLPFSFLYSQGDTYLNFRYYICYFHSLTCLICYSIFAACYLNFLCSSKPPSMCCLLKCRLRITDHLRS